MRLRVEADLPAAIAAAAEKQRTKPAEWMRQRLREAVRAEGVELPPLAGDGDRASMFAAANTGLESADGQPLPMAAGMGR